MGVFSSSLMAGRDFLCRAVVEAGRELGIFAALSYRACDVDALAKRLRLEVGRVRPIVDLLVFEGFLAREGSTLVAPAGTPEERPVPQEGWGLLTEVVRSREPLVADDSTEASAVTRKRYHDHLVRSAAAPAAEVARLLGEVVHGASVLDLGGGAGAYSRALVEAGARRAVIVDVPQVVEIAVESAAGDARVEVVAADLLTATFAPEHDLALLANVLHLFGHADCRALVATAAASVRPGGHVVVKDLFVEADRSGPAEALYFAVNMVAYTREGDVHLPDAIAAWLRDAGLDDVRVVRLEREAEGMVVIGRRPAP